MGIRDLYPDFGLTPNGTRSHARRVIEPLLEPARGSHSSPAYNLHSYHTKVPPEAIEPFIEHHTHRGAVVLDPFAGSGMTGVAARRLGRRAKLNDLSPAAAHIAWNATHDCDPARLQATADEVLHETTSTFARLYGAACDRCGGNATIAFTIWSDHLRCPGCGAAVSVWEHAAEEATGRVADELECPTCRRSFRRRGAKRVASVPAAVAVDCVHCGRVTGPVSASMAERALAFRRDEIDVWYPTTPIGHDREMYIRSALGTRGIGSVADLYTARNLEALGAMWKAISSVSDRRIQQALALAFTNTAWHGTIMRRFNARGGQRPLTGTLYVPHLSSEVNVGRVFAHKVKQLTTFYRTERPSGDVEVAVGSAANLSGVPNRSIDYVFTDPPFGSNIFYADCNLVWESWLGTTTNVEDEAVVNRSLRQDAGGKTLEDYRELMLASFTEIARVLRRDAWATLVFHSTDAQVWSTIEEAAREGGFSLAGATYMDKTQLSHKGYRGRSGAEDVAAYDVILGLQNRKPPSRRARAHAEFRRETAIEILADHLTKLPPVGTDSASDRMRTLPYMHSLLVRHHFNGDIGLHIGAYDVVRAICTTTFEGDAAGRWRLRGTEQEAAGARAR